MSEAKLNLSFKVDVLHRVGKPIAHNLFNAFDQHGLLLGLPRLEAESNADYLNRLLDVKAKPANSTYLGLVYGISRRLGLSMYESIVVEAKKDSDGIFKAIAPSIRFRGPYVDLITDCSTDDPIVERTIDRFEKSGAYSLQELVDEINKSTYFQATLKAGISKFTRSMTIIDGESCQLRLTEQLPQTTIIQLAKKKIAKGSIFFTDKEIFKTEKSLPANISLKGDYAIDYKNGIVWTHTAPRVGATIRYKYILDPYTALSSPVIVYNLHSDEMHDKLFGQYADEFGNAYDGLPSKLGTDIINELMSVYPFVFGK